MCAFMCARVCLCVHVVYVCICVCMCEHARVCKCLAQETKMLLCDKCNLLWPLDLFLSFCKQGLSSCPSDENLFCFILFGPADTSCEALCFPSNVMRLSTFSICKPPCWLQMREEIVRQLPGRANTSVDSSSDLLFIAGHACPDTCLLPDAVHPEQSNQHDKQELGSFA